MSANMEEQTVPIDCFPKRNTEKLSKGVRIKSVRTRENNKGLQQPTDC